MSPAVCVVARGLTAFSKHDAAAGGAHGPSRRPGEAHPITPPGAAEQPAEAREWTPCTRFAVHAPRAKGARRRGGHPWAELRLRDQWPCHACCRALFLGQEVTTVPEPSDGEQRGGVGQTYGMHRRPTRGTGMPAGMALLVQAGGACSSACGWWRRPVARTSHQRCKEHSPRQVISCVVNEEHTAALASLAWWCLQFGRELY